MKTIPFKYISIFGFILFLIACSTKKDTFVSRNMNALATKDNILYNGGLALDNGISDLKLQYKDNYWEVLPIERMQVSKEEIIAEKMQPNPNFEIAETKATKAIQKHSMNIDGVEKNPQMDEAHLLLGKSRYYDQRFIPALEAFNYVLYKYPNSDKIYEVKIWREKTNIRLDNDALAVNNLTKLLKEIKFKDQIFSDANASLAQAYLNLELKDSAIAKIKLAKDFTKKSEERARYNFILGQLYQEMGKKDSAETYYRAVIAMNRQSPRQYNVFSYVKLAQMFDYQNGDKNAFVATYNKLVDDRENRPYLDVIFHQMGIFYEKTNDQELAIEFYKASLKTKSTDSYLMASDYRNLAEIYFHRAKYITAGKFYDSTLVQLNPRSREYIAIKKKRENLDDVIKYEEIAAKNDSIINLYNLSPADRISYFENYIAKLKLEEDARIALEAKKAIENNNAMLNGGNPNDNQSGMNDNGRPVSDQSNTRTTGLTQPPGSGNSFSNSSFYFYNPTTVAYGITDFKKRWGNIQLKDNWRTSSVEITQLQSNVEKDTKLIFSANASQTKEIYNVDFYLKQIPTAQIVIDSLSSQRNFANYQLGIIYTDKFKEYQLAANKYEQLLQQHPDEKLVLPSMYNLYKIYLIIDKNKALALEQKIISQYPNSRYAQILGNTNPANVDLNGTAEINYDQLYKLYENEDYKTVLLKIDPVITQFTGDEMVPKFELLKANTIGKIKGLEAYKKALTDLAFQYPNSDEGKAAAMILSSDIPKLESLKFYQVKATSWKIIYKVGDLEDKKTKTFIDKIKKFTSERKYDKLTMSVDLYTMDENFIVIHGFQSETAAKDVATILKEVKDYKIDNTAYVISNYNYKIVQIKKNFEEYLKTPYSDPVPVVETVAPPVLKAAPAPVQKAPSSASDKKAAPAAKTNTVPSINDDDPQNVVPAQMPPGTGKVPPAQPTTPRK